MSAQMSTHQTRAAAGHALPNVIATPEAVALLEDLTAEDGPQVLIMDSTCAAPTIMTVVSNKKFVPDDGQVFMTRLGPCPVYATTSKITLCPHETIVIDRARDRSETPMLVTRAESAAECQQRTFCAV